MQILGIEPTPEMRPNGKIPRNLAFVHMEIDGLKHRIPVRRSNSKPHLPLPLMAHKEAKKITKAAAACWLEFQASNAKAD